MVYRGLESQPVRRGGSYSVEEQTWFAQCSPFRSHSKSSRRLREVDLVLTLNSRPLLAPPPPSQKNVRKGLVSLYGVQNKQTLNSGEGPISPAPHARAGGGGRGEQQFFFCLVRIFAIDFHFLLLCFQEACLCRSRGVREILGRSCQTSKGEELSVLRV